MVPSSGSRVYQGQAPAKRIIRLLQPCAELRAQEVGAALLGLSGLLALLLVLSPMSSNNSSGLLSGSQLPQAQDMDQAMASGYGEVRSFSEYGKVASLFVRMGAYRGGPSSFAVVGLSSKSLHRVGNPSFQCRWRPRGSSAGLEKLPAARIQVHLPDWGLGRIYTVVVLNCSFTREIGPKGGQLVVTATYGDSDPFSPPEVFVALEEGPGEYDRAKYSGRYPYPYDYLFCGSPLFGDVSPQRIREWLAYHANLFGPRSHFVFHDAGGVHSGVRQVLQPWQKLGRVRVHNIRNEGRYDGHYHNQFLVLNDCLHRTRFLSNWTFFFDVDEYMYVPPGTTFHQVMRNYTAYTQVLVPQTRMSHNLCTQPSHDDPESGEQWAFRKLVYKQASPFNDFFKYAVQARHVYATGVHRTEQLEGDSVTADASHLRFYHYHGATSNRGKLCQQFAAPDPDNSTLFRSPGGDPYTLDGSMAQLAPSVQAFEVSTIGSQPSVP